MHTALTIPRIRNGSRVSFGRSSVARAFSHYQHKKTRHLESRSFAEAVEAEIRTNAFPAQWGVALRDVAQPMLGYVARGYYALQLELLGKMYRRNRVLVLIQWAWSYFTYERGARLITGGTSLPGWSALPSISPVIPPSRNCFEVRGTKRR